MSITVLHRSATPIEIRAGDTLRKVYVVIAM